MKKQILGPVRRCVSMCDRCDDRKRAAIAAMLALDQAPAVHKAYSRTCETCVQAREMVPHITEVFELSRSLDPGAERKRQEEGA